MKAPGYRVVGIVGILATFAGVIVALIFYHPVEAVGTAPWGEIQGKLPRLEDVDVFLPGVHMGMPVKSLLPLIPFKINKEGSSAWAYGGVYPQSGVIVVAKPALLPFPLEHSEYFSYSYRNGHITGACTREKSDQKEVIVRFQELVKRSLAVFHVPPKMSDNTVSWYFGPRGLARFEIYRAEAELGICLTYFGRTSRVEPKVRALSESNGVYIALTEPLLASRFLTAEIQFTSLREEVLDSLVRNGIQFKEHLPAAYMGNYTPNFQFEKSAALLGMSRPARIQFAVQYLPEGVVGFGMSCADESECSGVFDAWHGYLTASLGPPVPEQGRSNSFFWREGVRAIVWLHGDRKVAQLSIGPD